IVAPYFDSRKKDLKLPAKQKSLLYIYCWSVHHSDQFRSYMKVSHPNIILCFVPANCTGVFQPCDVRIQWPFKLSCKCSCHEVVVKEVSDGLDKGEASGHIQIRKEIGVLCDHSVKWLWKVLNDLNKPKLVQSVCNTSFNILLHLFALIYLLVL
ncbi:hypothetical protein M422DRAFT_159836, partial [Sphaerobolus stellatus SS14]